MTKFRMCGSVMSPHIYHAYLAATASDDNSPESAIYNLMRTLDVSGVADACDAFVELHRIYSGCFIELLRQIGYNTNDITVENLLIKTNSAWRILKSMYTPSLVIPRAISDPEVFVIVERLGNNSGISLFKAKNNSVVSYIAVRDSMELRR